MDELVERVREALAAEYSGAGDGRIRDVPDRRAIRWYTTIGLVDRPLGMRGRSALYGPRHLQQLVAIKRQQAAGRSLSQIQGDFTWLSDDGLAELSGVPERLLVTDGPEPDDAADDRHMRFWARQPATAPQPAAIPQPAAAGRQAGPEEHDPALSCEALPHARLGDAGPGYAGPVNGVALRGGAILLVPHPLSEDDREAIATAAAPLLALLDNRGLLDGRSK
jgi:DNA-binding transcriptional MerR regulator